MSSRKDPSDYTCFIKNELATLSFISGETIIQTYFRDFYARATSLYAQYRGKKNNILKKSPLRFYTNLQLSVEDRVRTVHLGIDLEPNFAQSSYMFAICKCEEPSSEVIRKFHFDYCKPRKDESPKPTYHIQYPGESSEEMQDNGIRVEHLYPQISNPRIDYRPINIALILDLLFNEFETEQSRKLVESKNWRDIIKSNEEFILKPYFLEMNNFFNKDHHSSFLFREYSYGKR